jgi:hypothetical protein
MSRSNSAKKSLQSEWETALGSLFTAFDVSVRDALKIADKILPGFELSKYAFSKKNGTCPFE